MSPESLERVSGKLGGAHRQVDRLASLVTTLLDVSRIATGRISLELSEVDITLAVPEALERLRSPRRFIAGSDFAWAVGRDTENQRAGCGIGD